MMNNWNMGPWGSGSWVVMAVGMVLVVLVVVAAVVWVARAAGGDRSSSGTAAAPGPGAAPSARDVLDTRFARGEIDEDEYTRRRQVLEGRPAPATETP